MIPGSCDLINGGKAAQVTSVENPLLPKAHRQIYEGKRSKGKRRCEKIKL
jgi:hypothetical protein